MAVDPDDYIEDKEEPQDSEYIRKKKMMNMVFYEIKNLEQQLCDMKVSFDDAQRANASGVQNVYNKFIELETRQLAIEELLESKHIKDMLKSIPNEENLLKMFDMINNHPVTDLREGIDKIREDLQEMVDRFTF